jgi:uncharacterized protein YijF (DUF1287 family)
MMINSRVFVQTGKVGSVLGAALLVLNTGCAVRVNEPAGSTVYVAAQDEYVYYPGYNTYYNSYRHEYAYPEGRGWVSRPQPRGVSVDVLRASPSVKMDFHDSPAAHHAAVVQQYPKNWTPTAKAANHDDARRPEGNGK